MSYIEKIENGELFVLCKNTVSDYEGVYCTEGREYKVVDLGDNENYEECFIILTEIEYNEMQIRMDDSDFEIIIKDNIEEE